jgi:hypothetical protein
MIIPREDRDGERLAWREIEGELDRPDHPNVDGNL